MDINPEKNKTKKLLSIFHWILLLTLLLKCNLLMFRISPHW